MPRIPLKFSEVQPGQLDRWFYPPDEWDPMTVAWANITGKPSTFPPSAHNHDSRYYTKAQINVMLGLASDYWVDTQVELTALPMPTTKTFRIMRGLNAVGDGLIVMVIWVPLETATADGIDYFLPNGQDPLSPGRWVRFNV